MPGVSSIHSPTAPGRPGLTLRIGGTSALLRAPQLRQRPQHEHRARPGQRGPGPAGRGRSPTQPGWGSCCSGTAALQHPDPLGCPPPSPPPNHHNCLSLSVAHGLQMGGWVCPGPARSFPGPSSAAGGGERSVWRGKHAGGLSLLPAPLWGASIRRRCPAKLCGAAVGPIGTRWAPARPGAAGQRWALMLSPRNTVYIYI